MTDKGRILGQYETPAAVADLVLGFCVQSVGERILDPSCGEGAFLGRAKSYLSWLADSEGAEEDQSDHLWGIELDIEAAAKAQFSVPEAQIICRDFFDMEPWSGTSFDTIVGNPPYTRSEWIAQIAEVDKQAQQLPIFGDDEAHPSTAEQQLTGAAKLVKVDSELAILGRRAGLHAFFFIHGLDFLKEGGRFGFVLPNSWLDVAYGERLKRFLLEHYRILAIIESNVERWFQKARVNTCLLILEKCSAFDARVSNQVHLIQLRRTLNQLITHELDDEKRYPQIKQLAEQILANKSSHSEYHARVLQQHDLNPREKWGIYLRSPARYQKRISEAALHPLGSWARISRGYTTGVNEFFYLGKEAIEIWSVESRFRRPLLKSLRHINKRTISAEDAEHEVLVVESDASISNTFVEKYIRWGEEQGFNLGTTCAGRHRWYSLPRQEQSQVLLPKGIWGRHFAVLAPEDVLVDQQIYRVFLAEGVEPLVAAALLNSAWFALQLELNGRVNFGEGVLWMAQYELEEVLLPDPRYMGKNEQDKLVSLMEELLEKPIRALRADAEEGPWQELNDIIFDAMGFSNSDRESVMESLFERISVRHLKAGT